MAWDGSRGFPVGWDAGEEEICLVVHKYKTNQSLLLVLVSGFLVSFKRLPGATIV